MTCAPCVQAAKKKQGPLVQEISGMTGVLCAHRRLTDGCGMRLTPLHS